MPPFDQEYHNRSMAFLELLESLFQQKLFAGLDRDKIAIVMDRIEFNNGDIHDPVDQVQSTYTSVYFRIKHQPFGRAVKWGTDFIDSEAEEIREPNQLKSSTKMLPPGNHVPDP